MLVLTRKMRESIAVGRSDGGEPMLTVTVLDIRGGKVRLGFEGDPSVCVHRWELWERIRTRDERDQSDKPAEDAATLQRDDD